MVHYLDCFWLSVMFIQLAVMPLPVPLNLCTTGCYKNFVVVVVIIIICVSLSIVRSICKCSLCCQCPVFLSAYLTDAYVLRKKLYCRHYDAILKAIFSSLMVPQNDPSFQTNADFSALWKFVDIQISVSSRKLTTSFAVDLR